MKGQIMMESQKKIQIKVHQKMIKNQIKVNVLIEEQKQILLEKIFQKHN